MYVQPTDAHHYNGKGFKNDDQSSARGQRRPPQCLIPLAEGGRDYMCRWVLSQKWKDPVDRSAILAKLNTCAASRTQSRTGRTQAPA